MARAKFWHGSVGPFFYETTDTYEDGSPHRGLYDPDGPGLGGASGTIRVITNKDTGSYVDLTFTDGLLTDFASGP